MPFPENFEQLLSDSDATIRLPQLLRNDSHSFCHAHVLPLYHNLIWACGECRKDRLVGAFIS